MMVHPVTGIVAGALTALEVDPEKIATVHTTLQKLNDLISSSRFMDLQVEPAVFGGSPESSATANHHAVAKAVVEETIQGLVVDLTTFAEATTRAATLIDTADADAGADLDARRQALEVLQEATRYSEADARNWQARDEHVPGTSDTVVP